MHKCLKQKQNPCQQNNIFKSRPGENISYIQTGGLTKVIKAYITAERHLDRIQLVLNTCTCI